MNINNNNIKFSDLVAMCNKFSNNSSFDNKIYLSNVKHYNVKIKKKKEPLLKIIVGTLSYALFIWLLLIGLTLLLYVSNNKIRELKGDYSAPKYNAYVVLSGSMEPGIKVYDVVVTKKVPLEKISVNDIITFIPTNRSFQGFSITHRITNVVYDENLDRILFQTKGDNNKIYDSGLVEYSDIYGKVIFKIPKLGYLQSFLAQKSGFIIGILIPCLCVISYDIVKLIKYIKEKK